MKQQNFLFVDIVSSIFLLVILIGNFMGLLYITEGNLVVSMLGSLFLVICYFFVVQLLKKNKEEMYKKKFVHPSLLFWVFFILLGFVSFNLMAHFINVEYNCKQEIKKEANAKINIVDSIAGVYKKRAKEDIQNFEVKIDSALNEYTRTKKSDLRNILRSAPYNIDASVLDSNPKYINIKEIVNAKTAPYQIKIDENIKNIDSTVNLNSKKYQSVFNNWKRLSLVATYSLLNQYVEDNVKLINSKLAELPINKTPITVTFNSNQLPLNSPSKLKNRFPPDLALPLILIILIHLFILIPFLAHKVRGYGSSSSSGKKTDKSDNKQTGTIEL
jgi:Ca2+/Na+ antiporter